MDHMPIIDIFGAKIEPKFVPPDALLKMLIHENDILHDKSKNYKIFFLYNGFKLSLKSC